VKIEKKGIITQSNYIPWKGYFETIRNVDVFVVYDDMQYTKRDWRNRNIIKTTQGLKWLTIPVEVKGKFLQKIKDTRIADKSWNKSHLNQIKQAYSGAKCYREVKDWIQELYMTCEYDFLTDVNLHFIHGINKFLDIETEIRFSSEFVLAEDRNQRLINICKDLNITDYYSGPAAKAYMDLNLFNESNIIAHFLDYSNRLKYHQLYGDFIHEVSIIDLLLNEGEQSKNYIFQNS
jgi:hypothetical protein